MHLDDVYMCVCVAYDMAVATGPVVGANLSRTLLFRGCGLYTVHGKAMA